jgi:hypothetical protein
MACGLRKVCWLYHASFVEIEGDDIKAFFSVMVEVNNVDIKSVNEEIACDRTFLTTKEDLEYFFEQYCQALSNLPWEHILVTNPESIRKDERNGELVIPAIVFNGGGRPHLGEYTTQNGLITGVGLNHAFYMEPQQSKA